MNPDWLLALLGGLLIATLTAPVGVSGAVFLLPFQVTVLAVPSPAVTATNLLFNVISVPGALARYRRHGTLASSLTGQLLVGTLPGVVVGALIRVYLVPDGTVFKILIALLLIPLGISLLVRARRSRGGGENAQDRLLPTAQVVALGVGAGTIGGIYGIGGGALLAPLLVSLGCSPLRVAPAALTSTFVTSCVGVGTYGLLAMLGQPQAAPDWAVAVACGVGGLLGGYLGAALQPRLPSRFLTAFLGMLSIGVAAAYLWAVLG